MPSDRINSPEIPPFFHQWKISGKPVEFPLSTHPTRVEVEKFFHQAEGQHFKKIPMPSVRFPTVTAGTRVLGGVGEDRRWIPQSLKCR